LLAARELRREVVEPVAQADEAEGFGRAMRAVSAAVRSITGCDRVYAIACGQGALQIMDVQRAGKAPMKADEFLRGARLSKGFVLPSPA
jgi:methionyl-tRNA formyltransferase